MLLVKPWFNFLYFGDDNNCKIKMLHGVVLSFDMYYDVYNAGL